MFPLYRFSVFCGPLAWPGCFPLSPLSWTHTNPPLSLPRPFAPVHTPSGWLPPVKCPNKRHFWTLGFSKGNFIFGTYMLCACYVTHFSQCGVEKVWKGVLWCGDYAVFPVIISTKSLFGAWMLWYQYPSLTLPLCVWRVLEAWRKKWYSFWYCLVFFAGTNYKAK